ncbi:DUF423 domain-containing protein [Brumimicrobium salinarum]|uniref:DUF423 domain-containing protein n=1 Tax=Brumimicrobium salinarum TaxID=2058658 RepID=A0A2I0R4R1_9FLAO|nr:DUF423 domain-containing protein [Brumimicrobium salinarum]PKR81566.1 DUF423 domain-containing protein [Brumimicrobium salinarum]
MNNKKLILVGLIFILLGIILGAMGAHYLETIGIVEEQINSFKVGTSYLFYNGLGLLALAGVVDKFDFGILSPFRSIFWGTLLFSVSIFLLVLGKPLLNLNLGKFIGPVTPIGGLIMILGWTVLLVKFLRTYRS